MHSIAVHDFAACVLRGAVPDAPMRRRAFAAPLAIWRRVLGFEGCAVQFHHGLVAAGIAAEAPPALRRLLGEETSRALRQGIQALRQLPAIAELASAHGIRVMVLKGAARLLAGEAPGSRSIADIDLLVDPADAVRFHALLQSELGYTIVGTPEPHHLAGLGRGGHLGIEVHSRLAPDASPLDAAIREGARCIAAGRHPIEVPSPTMMLVHALEHAASVNWTGRYRLRDVCDVAALCGVGVVMPDVLARVAASPARRPMETLLSAAHALDSRSPLLRPHAWATVRRVSTARLALAVLPRDRLLAERMFRYAGVMAEGSPRTILRAGIGLARRLRVATLAGLTLVAGCSDGTAPEHYLVPDFVFTSDAGDVRGLHLFSRDTITRLSAANQEDSQAHSAAGRIVFTSRRDGNREIYIADLTLAGQQRLTTQAWDDAAPALDPTGAMIAFVSNRSGAPRIWVMGADGSDQQMLSTGSESFVPEGAPAWSPGGDRIAFSSTRTGTSQVFVLDLTAGAGAPVQVTRETAGAFLPAWTADGASVLYTTTPGRSTVRVVPRAGGDSRALAAGDAALSDASCAGTVCITVAAGEDGDGDIVSVGRLGRTPRPVTTGAPDDAEPAFLVR